MRRKAAAVLMVAALGGCMSTQGGPETGGGGNAPHWGKSSGPPTVPGVKGPHGESIAMTAPYDSAPPGNPYMARQMMNQSVPLSAVQFNNPAGGMGMPPGAMMPTTGLPRGPLLSPPGVPFGPGMPAGSNVPGGPGGPPTLRGMQPAGGVLPGVMPMGGGVINANIPPGMMPAGGIMQAQMAQANVAAGMRFQGQRTQIRFVRPSGMRVSWFTQGPDGKPMFSTTPIEAPGRYNFPQAAIYRLKLSNIEGRPGLEVYPTMEVVPCNPRTEAFLAHSAVPIDFTNEDFKQVAEGNYLVKVIYLPDPQYQDVAGTGTDEILSTRLDPGADPIQEALRRGSILVVLRMGNVDQEAPNTPPLNAPGPNAAPPMTAPPFLPPNGMVQPGPGVVPPPGFQVPFWGMKPGTPIASAPGTGASNSPSAPNSFLNAPAPGALSVPSTPLPGPSTQLPVLPSFAGPKPMPNGAQISIPKGPLVPGTSSTTKFQNVPPPFGSPGAPALAAPPTNTPGLPVSQPALPGNNGPAFPPMPGSIQTPAAPSGPGVSEGPSFPGAPPLSGGPEIRPTTAQLAGQTGR